MRQLSQVIPDVSELSTEDESRQRELATLSWGTTFALEAREAVEDEGLMVYGKKAEVRSTRAQDGSGNLTFAALQFDFFLASYPFLSIIWSDRPPWLLYLCRLHASSSPSRAKRTILDLSVSSHSLIQTLTLLCKASIRTSLLLLTLCPSSHPTVLQDLKD